MADEIAKFDPSAYVTAIRDKVKNALVDMIPDEQWNAMLQREIEAFARPSTTDQWGNRKEGDLYRLMREEITEYVKSMLRAPEWQEQWVGVHRRVSEEISKIITEHGASIINVWLGQAIQAFVDSLQRR
jgi:hypothetical protein